MRWLDEALASNALLWVSLAVLMLCLALWARRRSSDVLSRARARARRAHAEEESAGESMFLPPARAEPAVEVVDLDALLAGEPDPVAAAARLQLEEPTDIGMLPDSVQALTLMTPPPKVAADAARAVRPPAPVQAAPPAPPAGASTATAARQSIDIHVPLRELALAWFEARGYRPSPASEALRPIELVLRHRKNAARAYAFVVEPQPVSAQRARDLATQARAIGLVRLLVAAEAGIDGDAREQVRKLGVRLIDQAAMRAEFDKLEISVAAKIIAVARGRARARPHG